MSRFVRYSFVWQFAGGFVLGTLGLGAIHVVEGPSAETPRAIYAQR